MAFLDQLQQWIGIIVETTNSFLWDYLLLFLLCGTGIYFTVRLKFVQIRKFGSGMKKVFGNISLKGTEAGASGMTSFQSLATAIAAQVGTGNLAGAATALISGGPGAIFWMWVSAFFGMATIYAEAILAQKYKTTQNGEVIGGPVYYIKAAFHGKLGKILAAVFSLLLIVALGFIGNMVQSNSIGKAFHTSFGLNPLITGLAVALFSGIIFFGGRKFIASVAEKLVPIMALFYIIGSVVVICFNIDNIPGVFHDIFVYAFDPSSIMGGALGITVQKSVRYGVARGLFSNEAGMGSTPHAHAIARVKHPCDQGIVAMIGVFIDTFLILTLTALAILSTDVLGQGYAGVLKGADLTQAGFTTVFGNFGSVFIAVCMLFFAFSTIIGWYFFGEVNVKYLFGKKAVKIYAAIVLLFIVVGSCMKVDIVWALADCFNGLMVIPNLLALLALSGTVAKISRDYDLSQKANRLSALDKKKNRH